jgi:hypothetical protein
VLFRRRRLTIRGAVLWTSGAVFAFALAGYLVAAGSPAPYEFAVFVRAGTLDREALVPKMDLLEQVNGLGAAAALAPSLDASPWQIWRKYSVTAEGRLYVVRVRDVDPQRGRRLIEAVRDRLVIELRQRYEEAMAPHRAYMASLEQEVAALGLEASNLAAGGRARDPDASRAAADWRVALAQVRKQLRDAQVFAGLSEVPEAVGDVRRLEPHQAGRQLRLTLTGAVLGFVAALVALVVLAFSTHAFDRPYADADR